MLRASTGRRLQPVEHRERGSAAMDQGHDERGSLSDYTATIVDNTSPERDEDTWVLVPVLDRPGRFVCVFPDGSYAEWTPDETIVC